MSVKVVRNRFLPLTLVLLLSPFTLPSLAQDTLIFSAMFYNVENLFDCRHDSLKDDFEFLPTGDKRWTTWRYWQKLDAISEVITAAGAQHLPDLIGLCEVENDSVSFDLTRRSTLRTLGYRYVMTHSPDERGSDVALLYQRGMFKPIAHNEILIPAFAHQLSPTRNILYVKGVILSGDTLHVMVCHMPSRSGDPRKKRRLRRLALSVLRHSIDSLYGIEPEAKLIVMGDFNAEANEKMMRKVLQNRLCAFVPMPDVKNADIRGTYRYQGRWEYIDHIFVSRQLLNERASLHTSWNSYRLIAFPFMYESDMSHRGVKPRRTYQGPVYKGGVSDHFPVLLEFQMIL